MNIKVVGTNQIELKLKDDMIIFFSYQTPVAAFVNGKYYRTSKKYSNTTSKHINKWLPGDEVIEKEQEFFDALLE